MLNKKYDMSEFEDKDEMKQSVENYNVFSAAQKKILSILIDFDHPIPVDIIQKVAGASKQSFNFSIQGLLKLDFIVREKHRVFVYHINQQKMLEIVEIYKKQKKLTKTT